MNLQRDRFREEFNVSFVFIVPFFGVNYFIKRAPDFLDWRSGFFRFTPQKNYIVNLENDFPHNSAQSYNKLLDLRTLKKELDFDTGEQVRILKKECLLLRELGRYEEAVVPYDQALEINPDHDGTWNNRGVVLGESGRYEEAVVSYDQALEINPDHDGTWNNRGVALGESGRYEEAVVSYDQALEINPDHDGTWHNRGVVLGELGRYEEAVVSYDQALEINPDHDGTWNNRGVALGELGRYEEAVVSYDQALEINPDHDGTWHNRGVVLGELGRYEEVLRKCRVGIAHSTKIIKKNHQNSDLFLDIIDEQINQSTSKMRKLILSFFRLFLKLFG